MVDRRLFTPQLESLAHRCAVASGECDEFVLIAHKGRLSSVTVAKDGDGALLTLIDGEWREYDPIVLDGPDLPEDL